MRIYTYGPFQSRRLGLSLGINLLPDYKLCTFDCVYCEIGRTNKKFLVSPKYRIQLKPTLKFRKELTSVLIHFPHLNSITFGYNGYIAEVLLLSKVFSKFERTLTNFFGFC